MKNILITGGTGPLGNALSEYLSKGNNVVITTRKKNISNNNCTVIEGIDLLKEKDLIKLKSEINDLFSDKFSIINCVGYYINGQQPFLDTKLDYDNKVFDSNFKTVYNTAKYLTPLMIDRRGGNFISFSCNSVTYNYPWMIPFTTSKAAVESLTKSMANEFSEFGVMFNAFALATINSEAERLRKPYGDHDNWLDLNVISKSIENFIQNENPYLNGNVIKLFKHSDTFYNTGYFERIRK